MIQVCVVGVNHKTTPVAIRGKLAIGTDGIQQALLSLGEYITPGVILNTCNRIEVYVAAEEDTTVEPAIVNFLNNRSNLPQAEVLPYIYSYRGEAAIRHLFQVASGLDSMLIGEFEILGQVRHALEEAKKTGMIGLPLLNLFRHAVRTGRRVRNETGISRNALSVSSVAVELAAQAVGDISHSKVAVIGAGEAGRLVAKACHERGASRIVVVSRSEEKGRALATLLNGIWTPMENLRQELAICDIVISCSGAPHPILKAGLVSEVMNRRPKRSLVIIDIAVPQNVEPQVRQIENVFLYDVDELNSVCDSNQQLRESETVSATRIVNEEVERFISYWQTLETRPVVSALVEKAENIRRAQLNTTLKKLPVLSGDDQAYLEAMTKAIVQKILHTPIQCLKSNRHQKDFIQVAKELFGLDKEFRGEE